MALDKDETFTKLALSIITDWAVTANYTSFTGVPRVPGGGDTRVANTQVLTPVTPPLRYEKSFIDGTTIQSGDMKFYVAGLTWDAIFPGVQPKEGDIHEFDNTKWTIVNPNPIYSGDAIAVYAMQVRRGPGVNA